jgi:cytochrome P450
VTEVPVGQQRVAPELQGEKFDVTADCEVRGVRFRRGTRALVVFRTIMRRDRYFPNGSRFDIERTIDPPFRRLLFGAGPHACLGTGLALAEARQVLNAMSTLGDEIEIVTRRYNRRQTYPGYSSLAIRLRRDAAGRQPATTLRSTAAR